MKSRVVDDQLLRRSPRLNPLPNSRLVQLSSELLQTVLLHVSQNPTTGAHVPNLLQAARSSCKALLNSSDSLRTSITLTTKQLRPEARGFLSRFTNLREVRITGCTQRSRFLGGLGTLQQIARDLTSLTLDSGCATVMPFHEVNRALHPWRLTLQSLTLINIRLSYAGQGHAITTWAPDLPVLKQLLLQGCAPLRVLNVANCSSLQELRLTDNTTLEKCVGMAGLVGFESFTCIGSKAMRVIDLSGCTALQHLDCNHNMLLSSLDLSGCLALSHLTCAGTTQLSSLSLADCVAMTHINCMDNEHLMSLDLAACKALQSVFCLRNDSLAAINLQGMSRLQDICCIGNVSLKLVNCFMCPNLLNVDCDGDIESEDGDARFVMNLLGCHSLLGLDCCYTLAVHEGPLLVVDGVVLALEDEDEEDDEEEEEEEEEEDMMEE